MCGIASASRSNASCGEIVMTWGKNPIRSLIRSSFHHLTRTVARDSIITEPASARKGVL